MPEGARKVLLITGLSGAGMSTALKALEDAGYQAVDNIPLSLVEPLLAQREGKDRKVALAIDSRAWDFSAERLLKEVARLRGLRELDVELVFIGCRDDVLQQRFTETRRTHPLAHDRPVQDGIALERLHLKPVKQAADHFIDTTDMKARDLDRFVSLRFGVRDGQGLKVFVSSFGFKNGLPRDADLVFDVRFLANPHWIKKLRPLTGRNRLVAQKVLKDPAYAGFFEKATGLIQYLLPRYDADGRSYLTIAVGCTGGRHRSVAVAEELHRWLLREGYGAHLRHRDLEKGSKHK